MFSFLTKMFRPKSRPAAPKRRVSLGVETLEGRDVPSSFTLNQGVLTIDITEANRGIKVTQSNGVVAISGLSHGWYDWAVKKIDVQGGPGTCSIDLSGVRTIPSEIHGGSGNNYIYGTQTNDVIYGGHGWNIIFGDGGNDALHGTGTTNRLIAGPGSSSLYGDSGLNFMDGAENRGGHPQYYASNGTTDYAAEAYAPGNVFTKEQIHQGTNNFNCAFLAALQGMAQAGVKMSNYINFAGVNSYGQGLYNVWLYNGRQWITERVVFDGSTTATDTQPTGNLASWAIIMDRAWQQFHGNTGAADSAALLALGRNPTDYSSFGSTAYFNLVGARLRQGFVVTACTGSSVGMNNLVTDHAYTVVAVGYNAYGVPFVKVRNPWGFNLVKGNPSGPLDAEMWLTWNDFARNFISMTIG